MMLTSLKKLFLAVIFLTLVSFLIFLSFSETSETKTYENFLKMDELLILSNDNVSEFIPKVFLTKNVKFSKIQSEIYETFKFCDEKISKDIKIFHENTKICQIMKTMKHAKITSTSIFQEGWGVFKMKFILEGEVEVIFKPAIYKR